MIKKELIIINKLGMHGRASAKFAILASAFKTTEIVAQRGERKCNGKSSMGVNMLALASGSRFTIYADGPEEAEAIERLTELVQNGRNQSSAPLVQATRRSRVDGGWIGMFA